MMRGLRPASAMGIRSPHSRILAAGAIAALVLAAGVLGGSAIAAHARPGRDARAVP